MIIKILTLIDHIYDPIDNLLRLFNLILLTCSNDQAVLKRLNLHTQRILNYCQAAIQAAAQLRQNPVINYIYDLFPYFSILLIFRLQRQLTDPIGWAVLWESRNLHFFAGDFAHCNAIFTER